MSLSHGSSLNSKQLCLLKVVSNQSPGSIAGVRKVGQIHTRIEHLRSETPFWTSTRSRGPDALMKHRTTITLTMATPKAVPHKDHPTDRAIFSATTSLACDISSSSCIRRTKVGLCACKKPSNISRFGRSTIKTSSS